PQAGTTTRTRRRVAGPASARRKPSAIHFAVRWVIPATHTATEPTSGTSTRSVRMYDISSTPQPPLDEGNPEHQGYNDHDPQHDDPRIVLDLARLPLPEPHARPHRLEAHRVDGAVDDPSVECVRPGGGREAATADRIHDPVDDLSVEPVETPCNPVHHGPAERVVRIVDPVPLRQHAVQERRPPGGGEALRRDALRRVDRPRECEA